ncbi:hypothetical protein T4B_1287 [Trichinella pseudospiralis]|uniref:Uncharacterized protein n=1 Tax=Trichinella pseudospiralis TaxID=6337 RepID=A0A0V1K334_TRIPS|nr:hypothetical protein T4A_345 [Trichinella pseudospiralis]KRZ08568.1 hypothetical protein T4B_1287 [Trichinella pseudospiralis]KRZ41526.1 hypothetical protein T4C_11586 [Trichinella pseudospiralis]
MLPSLEELNALRSVLWKYRPCLPSHRHAECGPFESTTATTAASPASRLATNGHRYAQPERHRTGEQSLVSAHPSSSGARRMALRGCVPYPFRVSMIHWTHFPAPVGPAGPSRLPPPWADSSSGYWQIPVDEANGLAVLPASSSSVVLTRCRFPRVTALRC